MGKTVAFPVIGLGLDAAPLKKGLKDAQSDVNGMSFASKAWGIIDSTISKVGNLPKTLSQAALPINQSLELAGKAQRLLGAPLRAQMTMEAGNADVMAGGNALLGSGTLSGTMARFERSFEDMLANIWNAVDSAFDVQGLIEGLRGGMAGVSAIIEAAFGPINQLGKDPAVLSAQFEAGANVVIDAFESVGKVAIDIYNGFFEVVKLISKIPGLGILEAFSAGDEAKIANYQKAYAREQMVPVSTTVGGRAVFRFEAQMTDAPREEAIKALREIDEIAQTATRMGYEGIEAVAANARNNIAKGFKPKVADKDAGEANRSLADLTKSFKTGANAIEVIEQQFARDVEAINRAVNAGADNMLAEQAYGAAIEKRDLARLESLKPMMQMQEQSRFSVSFEPNSQALIESMIRAQTGTGADNPQERVAQAVELQNQMLTEQAKIQRQQLDALNQIRNRPGAVFVGGIN